MSAVRVAHATPPQVPPLPSLKSAVIMNAFSPKDQILQELLGTAGVLKTIRLVHVVATSDGLREAGIRLSKTMGGDLVEHSGGHEIANNSNGKQAVAAIKKALTV